MAEQNLTGQAKALSEMTVLELEQESYRLNAEISTKRDEAVTVQEWLGKRNEEARVSQLLGRDVQLVEAPSMVAPEEASGSFA